MGTFNDPCFGGFVKPFKNNDPGGAHRARLGRRAADANSAGPANSTDGPIEPWTPL